MFNYLWPIFTVIIANTLYHVVQKSTPQDASPFGSLVITYGVATIICLIVYIIQNPGKQFIEGFKSLNWTSVALGVIIIALEFGWMMSYRNGWNISTCSIVANVALAIVLIFVGHFAFKESISAKNIVGAVLCIAGIIFINL